MDVKLIPRFISTLPAVVALLYADVLLSEQTTEVVSLQKDDFEHIQFKRIKANNFSYQNQQLRIDVDDSASILMLPFETVKPVYKVSFQWRSEGVPLIKDAEHELERSGDDAVFKLGLLLKADDESLNPFIASWLRKVRKQLHFPSENMIYLVVDAKHKPNEQWLSPYNKRITMISVASQKDESDWQQASYQFDSAQQVVALWLMADGDNTHASFSVSVKNIVLEKINE